MSAVDPQSRWRTRHRTVLCVLCGVVLLSFLAGWLMPQYQSQIVTAGDAQRWSEAAAPQRREIIWQTAIALESDSGQASQPNDPLDDRGAESRVKYLCFNDDGGFGGMDLYESRLEGDVWTTPINLGSNVNSSADERDPIVSPDGAFLLFASNRPTNYQEAANFDIYRMRIDRLDLPPENLGMGINTPANEIEPALSAAGFQLMFTRFDANQTAPFSRYQSTAREVFHERQWDVSRWRALSGLAGRGLDGMYNHLTWLLLILAAMAVLGWLVRQIQNHRLALPGFLIAALMIHLLLATSSFFVYFQPGLVQRIKALFEEELVVATQVLASSTAATVAEQPSFASVAELDLPVPRTPDELPRQSVEVPLETQPIELQTPASVVSKMNPGDTMPADAIVATVLVKDPSVQKVAMLPRVAVSHEPTTEQVELQRTVAVILPQLEPLRPVAVELDRQSQAAKSLLEIEMALPDRDSLTDNAAPPASETVEPHEWIDRVAIPQTNPLARTPAALPMLIAEPAIALGSLKTVDATPPAPTLIVPTKIELAAQKFSPTAIEASPLTLANEVAQPTMLSPDRSIDSAPKAAAPSPGSVLPGRALPPAREYADASVNLQNLLLRRKLDEATKLAVIRQFGGNDETLATIHRGLTWIEQHQASDGHWGLHDFHECCRDHQKCDGRGSTNSDAAGTALALLPLLGDGNTHQHGTYKDTVARGIGWLVKQQKPDGNFFTGGEANSLMYSHAIATIAICECYNMSGDLSLRIPAQRGIDFIIASQDLRSGGWRYQPREQADTSVVGWQVMALKSGQMADLNVTPKSLQEAHRWLDSVAGANSQLGQYAYQNGRFNLAMTAEAILCLEYLGQDRSSGSMVQGAKYLVENLPQAGRETSYYWYYATQALFHLQGEPWQQWNAAIHPLLIDSQRKEGPLAGTWDARDQWEQRGGRIYSTSLRLLMLEVYYRHLPIYNVIE